MAVDNFEEKINILEKEAREAINQSSSLLQLEKVKTEYLGRKSEFNNLIKELPKISKELRVRLGSRLNSLKDDLEILISEESRKLKDKSIEKELKKQDIDVTMPSRGLSLGHLHPLTKVERRVEDIFESLGFSIVFGPEIESEYYNFDALNIPKNHPARDMQDTFWIKNQELEIRNPKSHLLLRTHTSPIEVRYMEKNNPPLKIIAPGRVYRYEASDASHDIQFYQIEGLMVDKNISLANLKAIFEAFFKRFFGNKKVAIRFRPGYFPFVEPGIEVDIKFGFNSKWLEVAGAGMTHPKVFKAAGYIPDQWQGFAFGMGLERLAMLYYGINDIRLFYSSDFRFLKQF